MKHLVGDDQFLRVDAQDIGEQPLQFALGDAEDAGGNVDPGQRIDGLVAALDAGERHQIVAVAGIEEFSSVMVPGVTSRITSRRTTDFAPRFLASAGSSICSQTATR